MIHRLGPLAALALSLVLGPSKCPAQPCPPTWSQPDPSPIYTSAVYDSGRGIVVIRENAGPTGSTRTWEGNGATWTAVSDSGPSPRWNFAMAYDSGRHRVVLFGGYSDTAGRLNDTWEWDGAVWVQRATTGPSPRYDTAMAYDPNLHLVVLHGGDVRDAISPSTITASSDTWTWDGSAWTLVIPDFATRPWREGHAMTFDPLLSSVVVLGGSEFDSNLMRFTGTEWVVVGAGPGTVFYAPLAFDSQRGRLILCGGGTLHYEWDGQTWSHVPPSGPIRRDYASLVFDPGMQRTLLFGGVSFNGAEIEADRDSWAWDGTNWTALISPCPTARLGTAMVYDNLRDTFVLFGGSASPQGGTTADLSDTWEFHNGQWSLRSTSGPAPRAYHSLAFDSDRGRTILYGGMGAQAPPPSNYFGDTWEWDGATWIQTQSTGPSPRWRAPLVYDPIHHAAVLFGGGPSSATSIDDTWLYDATGWHQASPATRPSARYGAAMAFDSATGHVLLFGGDHSYNEFLADLWSWDGSTWAQVPFNSGPSGRRSAGMAFDSSRNTLVLACGAGAANWVTGDVWEWNGQTWSQSASSPGARSLFAFAFDSTRAQCRLFGGLVGTSSSNGVVDDQWIYSVPSPPAPVRDPLDVRACPDFPVSLSAQFSGTTPLSLQWAHDGVSIDGAHSHILTIPHPSPADAGTYTCTATNACSSATSAPATLTFSAVCCGSADFNGDGNFGTDADIEAFFACLAGNCCPTCGSADFNLDGDLGTDADIEAFFRVLAGGSC